MTTSSLTLDEIYALAQEALLGAGANAEVTAPPDKSETSIADRLHLCDLVESASGILADAWRLQQKV